jgi:hypothetical protein
MPFMSRLTFIVLLSLVTLYSKGQEYSFKATSPNVEATMQNAVVNAKKFIVHTITPEVYEKHFQLIPSLSEVKSDYTSYHYTPHMNDTISFTPGKYELRYLIKIESDTLTDSFVIPVDSLGQVDLDTSNFHYILEDLKAYKKLFTGQYKFDYHDVKQFIKSKGLKEYFILLGNSIELIHIKEYEQIKQHKHYWFVYRYYPGFEIVYRIDPDTGKYTFTKRKVEVVS